MAGEQTRPKWVGILHVYRWALFAPARSMAAKFCRFFVVFKAVMVVLELLLPGAGVAYLSGDHLWDVGDHLADGLVWFLALLFVRERDEARAENTDLKGTVSTYETAFQGMPLVLQAMRRRRD